MRVSSRADYGVRALFDLALRYGKGPVQSRDIAVRQGVPEAYLHQVLGALNRAGLVRSTRGPLGGHELARDPGDITLWDVLNVLDGPDRRAHPHLDHVSTNDPVHQTWHELQSRSIVYLESITLETLVDRAHSAQPTPNYSI
ncbi:MAG: RrF2 family transcriptional regulator [Thermomicrobiales bacterium]